MTFHDVPPTQPWGQGLCLCLCQGNLVKRVEAGQGLALPTILREKKSKVEGSGEEGELQSFKGLVGEVIRKGGGRAFGVGWGRCIIPSAMA